MRALVTASVLLALGCLDSEVRAADERQLRCLADSEAAQRLRLSGKLVGARERFVRCAHAECPPVVRQDCEGALAGVDAALPTVIVAARDAEGRDVRAVRVTVDGEPFAQALDGRSIPIDPGAHTFRYESEGYVSVEQPVVVREAEKQRFLEVHLVPTPARQDSARAPLGAYALAGVAAAALLVGSYFGVRALADYQSMQDRCGALHDCTNDEAAAVRRRAVIADVSFGVALVTGAISAWLFLRRPASPQSAGVARF
jgi:hypothetical protein